MEPVVSQSYTVCWEIYENADGGVSGKRFLLCFLLDSWVVPGAIPRVRGEVFNNGMIIQPQTDLA